MSEEILKNEVVETQYDASQIQVLEGLEAMWRRGLERYIWYIFAPDHSARSFAVRWAGRLPSKK